MTKHRMLATTAIVAGAIVTGLVGSGAAAQTTPAPASSAAASAPANDGGLEDIVVTAQRRSETVQTVPIAISAFSGEQLAQRGVTNTLNLIQYVPNLFGSNNTGLGSANAYYIRGLGNTESIATFDPPVGTYVDDVYLSRQNANNFSFFDVQRIEVLRGPQGTLFGRNTTGGAINVILAQPSDEVHGYLEAGYGSYAKKTTRGSIDLPLGDMLSVKLSGYYQDDHGYVKNTTTGQRNNDDDGAGLRGAFKLKLTDKLTWNGAVAYMRSDGENLLNFECDPNNPTKCDGRYISTGVLKSYDAAHPSPFSKLGVTGRKANFGLRNKTDTVLTTSNIQWADDDFTINYITGIVDLKQKYALDFADGRGLSPNIFPNIADPRGTVRGFASGTYVILNDAKNTEFTNELKINGKLFDGFLDYVAGAYFYHESNTTDFADALNIGLNFPGGFAVVLADRTLRNKTNAQAGYVQVDANVSDAFKLTAGIRYTDEKKTFNIRDNRATCQVSPLPATCLGNANLKVALISGTIPIPTTQEAKLWTPRFAVNYQLPNLLLFASATRGFKSGGWNARGTANNTLLPFAPEKVWSYESGIKSEFLDRRLRVNATVFYLDTSNLQTPSAFVDPTTGAASFITQNFADYRNYGVELEVTAVPVTGLNVYANVGYQNDKYKVSDTLLPNRYGVKAVRQQQADCRTQLAAKKIPLAPGGPNNAADCGAGIVDVNGNIATPVRTPDWSVAVGGTYDVPIPSAGIILQPSVNVVYRSKLETGTANASLYTGSITGVSGAVYPANPFGGDLIGGSLTKSYIQVNAAFSLRTDDGNWIVSAECNNCTDKTYAQSSLVNYTYLSPPRTWLVRAKRSF